MKAKTKEDGRVIMKEKEEIAEIVELTVEELEEKIAPGIVIIWH